MEEDIQITGQIVESWDCGCKLQIIRLDPKLTDEGKTYDYAGVCRHRVRCFDIDIIGDVTDLKHADGEKPIDGNYIYRICIQCTTSTKDVDPRLVYCYTCDHSNDCCGACGVCLICGNLPG